MPRTKVARKEKPRKLPAWVSNLLADLEANELAAKVQFEQNRNKLVSELRKQFVESKKSIPPHLLKKTIGELCEHPEDWSGASVSVSKTHILSETATKSLTTKKKPVTRSSSFDEGYLTAEGGSNFTAGRTSRARSRVPNSRRVSRSLSNQSKIMRSVVQNKYKTPAQKIPLPATYGTVTPKVKPNTPQVLLRRPQQGEVALSLQGSPLLTGNVISDNFANINIPLQDGRVLSIQPEKGLRLSELPTLDDETQRQLKTLRDNLNKVCLLSERK